MLWGKISMKILITGSNGFVGRTLAEILVKEYYVIGTGTREESLAQLNEYVRWNFAAEDCPKELDEKEIDVIIHVAACLDKDDMCGQLVETNCVGTHRLYQMACKKGVKKVIYISSIPVIGVPVEHPITELHNTLPETMYHATKLAGEMILNQLLYRGIEIITLRLPSPIAPGMPIKTILPIFAQKALQGENISIQGEGTRRQNYLDLRDLAEVVKSCIELRNISGIYNIASIQTISNLELAKLCVSLTGNVSRIVFSGKKDLTDGQVWDVDVTKAKEVLNYRQKYMITDSVKDIIDEMRAE